MTVATAPARAEVALSRPLQSVRVAGLGRVYDEHYALLGLDAHFPAGSVTALLGPNGAGKSTLIAILSTLLRPSEGEIYFDDHPVSARLASVRHLVGFVGHRTMLYGALSARENLHFFGHLYGCRDMVRRVEALLDEVALTDAADRPVHGFSRGMAQRLTLARALLPAPPLLLLDEPLTGLDQAGIETAIQLIERRRAAGAIVVMSSHDLGATSRLADRALLLRRGRRVFEGPAGDDLLTLYREQIAA